jgi:molybdopterin-containing oxidoreductase family membrane subunit
MDRKDPNDRYIMGLFRDDARAAEVVRDLPAKGYKVIRVHSPVPSQGLFDALKVKPSLVGWLTLVGGIIGFFSGFALAAFTAQRWEIVVSGKPILAWVPFVIVGFEFTVLFAVFGNVIGLLLMMKLPNFKGMKYYDPRCSGDHYGVLAACREGQQEALSDFFQNQGGEVRVFSE